MKKFLVTVVAFLNNPLTNISVGFFGAVLSILLILKINFDFISFILGFAGFVFIDILSYGIVYFFRKKRNSPPSGEDKNSASVEK